MAVAIDLFDRSIVGWALDDNMKKELVIEATKMAIKRRKPPRGLIAHSDRGSQYCSYAYQELLAKYRFKSSMSANVKINEKNSQHYSPKSSRQKGIAA